MDKKQHEIDIELDESVAEGNYANLVIISHSSSEFVLDFAAMMPGLPKAKVKNRIILAPEHAKRLLLSLQDNITRYESNVAQIKITKSEKELEEEEEAIKELNNSLIGFNIGEA